MLQRYSSCPARGAGRAQTAGAVTARAGGGAIAGRHGGCEWCNRAGWLRFDLASAVVSKEGLKIHQISQIPASAFQ
ncbi:hypothetical protein [Xanthomonas theicola]|uniref:hypothetical protein n=1 Tax=Xanthomonas theicola TaxID=56464 RepID=UPI000FF893B3|nr:hypothetical protein [Xanthomonas theicola]QNH26815.1 hypothetical protein G4Q83_21765 [Xanthomonas theicola]